jgi:hypothetical protein
MQHEGGGRLSTTGRSRTTWRYNQLARTLR